MNIFKKSKRTILSLAIGMSLIGFGEIGYSFNDKPFLKGVNDALSDSLEEPEKTVFGLGKDLVKGLIPSTSTDQQILNQLTTISSDLNIIMQQNAEILGLQAETLSAIVFEGEGYTNSALVGDITDLQNKFLFDKINGSYDALYSNNIFPISGDLYDFASQQCKVGGGSTPLCDSVVNVLFPDKAKKKPTNDADKPISDAMSQWSTGFKSGFGDLQSGYSEMLNLYDFKQIDATDVDYVSIYMQATIPVTSLQIQFYQNLAKLYNMQALQLAFIYADPDRFSDSSNNYFDINSINVFDGVTETGKEGYEAAMKNLTDAYVKTFLSGADTSIQSAFGGPGYQYDKDTNTISPTGDGIADSNSQVKLKSLNQFLKKTVFNGNKTTPGGSNVVFNEDNNDFFDADGHGLLGYGNTANKKSFLNNCQITQANFVYAGKGVGVSPLAFMCFVNDGTTGKLKMSMPFSLDTETESNNGYDFKFYDLTLNETDSKNGSYFVAPSTTAMEHLKTTSVFPDTNNDATSKFYTSNITGLTPGAKWICDQSDRNSTYNGCFSNQAFVSGDSVIFPALNLQFNGTYFFGYETANDARGSCVTTNQENDEGTAKCLTVKHGYYKPDEKDEVSNHVYLTPPYVAYGYQGTKQYFHAGTGMHFLLTNNGNLFRVHTDYPGYGFMTYSQTIQMSCFASDPSCKVSSGGDSLIFDNGMDKVSYSVNNDDLHEYTHNILYLADYKKYDIKSMVTPKYLFSPTKLHPQDGTTPPYQTHNLAFNFMKPGGVKMIDHDVTLMLSEDGNYRLVFFHDEADVKIQKKDPSGNWPDEGTYVYSAKNYSKNKTDIAGLSFSGGNLVTYYNNDGKLAKINSVADEYEAKYYNWISDPYAYIDLQTDGNLVIHSSNSSDAIGKLGLGDKQLLWAANWYSNTVDWNKIQNPKLQSSSSDSKSKESKDS